MDDLALPGDLGTVLTELEVDISFEYATYGGVAFVENTEFAITDGQQYTTPVWTYDADASVMSITLSASLAPSREVTTTLGTWTGDATPEVYGVASDLALTESTELYLAFCGVISPADLEGNITFEDLNPQMELCLGMGDIDGVEAWFFSWAIPTARDATIVNQCYSDPSYTTYYESPLYACAWPGTSDSLIPTFSVRLLEVNDAEPVEVLIQFQNLPGNVVFAPNDRFSIPEGARHTTPVGSYNESSAVLTISFEAARSSGSAYVAQRQAVFSDFDTWTASPARLLIPSTNTSSTDLTELSVAFCGNLSIDAYTAGLIGTPASPEVCIGLGDDGESWIGWATPIADGGSIVADCYSNEYFTDASEWAISTCAYPGDNDGALPGVTFVLLFTIPSSGG
ncbi:hypothetical protein GCM10009808_09610 [Microbacterium sediminicola]|uniref:Uncharacterized protein n=1 Tax=Microbacterium sediminicola TaxID=415210 RepID=A0ABN2HX24_9MICO